MQSAKARHEKPSRFYAILHRCAVLYCMAGIGYYQGECVFLDYLIRIFPGLIKATSTTLMLFGITLVISLPLGWLLSLARVSRNRVARRVVEAYCWVLRGTPLLLQLAFIYFGLPYILVAVKAPVESFFGVLGWVVEFPTSVPRLAAAVVGFGLNYSAYFAEIFRGGIEAVPRGQYEAADVLGMSNRQVMMRIVLPQAFKTVLPSVGNEVITLIKDTALVYTLGIADLLRVAQSAVTRDFRSEPFFGAAIIYLVLTYVLTRLMAYIEKKFDYYH